MMFLAVVMVALAGVQADSRQLAIKKLVGFVPTTSIADMVRTEECKCGGPFVCGPHSFIPVLDRPGPSCH